MSPIESAILGLYFLTLVILALFGLHRYVMVFLYFRHRDRRALPSPPTGRLPRVTVQLPLYNEMYAVERHRAQGFDVRYLHREHRDGFKAGALDEGLKVATGEFVLIFDADFIAPPEILMQTLGHFSDPGVGMVQVRWGHVNRDYSLLTQVQSVLLDGHFILEHCGRNRSGRFFNFN